MLAVEHTYTLTTARPPKTRRPMKRVLFAMLLCALGPAQASAQNDTSLQLLELDEEQRNAAFAHMLWDSERAIKSSERFSTAPFWAWTTGRCFVGTDVLTPLASLWNQNCTTPSLRY
jgi:hypothetical protein